MPASHNKFAKNLAAAIITCSDQLTLHATDNFKLQVTKSNGDIASLDLTPFVARPQPVTAKPIFQSVKNVAQLIEAYRTARQTLPFEKDIEGAYDNVSDYADEFLATNFSNATSCFTDEQACLVAEWVSDLDIYAAVKSIESLLNSRADIASLTLAKEKGWAVSFDHMAIRCGSSSTKDAERVVKLLCGEHGYVPSQAQGESYYEFPEGWNAYPLYKILENGQVLRIFVDQSAEGYPEQIIQHWNYVYGYTAHHLAMRFTRLVAGERVAVSLNEVIEALTDGGVESMAPTGMYTEGLLEQVFTRPEQNKGIPEAVMQSFRAIDAMPAKIGNGKLLELVSRKEVGAQLAAEFYAIYGLIYDQSNSLHSVPVYTYFLPAQAAHVIKTSIEIDN